jgi:hypothetical protein
MLLRSLASSALVLGLAACNPGPSSPAEGTSSGGEVCPARVDANALAEQLQACRTAEAALPPWPAQESYDAAFELARAHLADVSDEEETPTESVQPVADAIWAFLDQVTFPPQNEALRTSAENAAEALLRDRDHEHAPAAAQAAYEAITAVRATLHPPSPDACAELATRSDDARARAVATCT